MRFPKALPPYSGACLCGNVKYELTAWPVTYYACHCIDCQRRTGGAMRLAMWVEKAALKVVHGQPKLRVFEFGEGRQRRAMFCVDCGTRLWAEPTNRPQLASLFPGTLYNHAEFEPIFGQEAPCLGCHSRRARGSTILSQATGMNSKFCGNRQLRLVSHQMPPNPSFKRTCLRHAA